MFNLAMAAALPKQGSRILLKGKFLIAGFPVRQFSGANNSKLFANDYYGDCDEPDLKASKLGGLFIFRSNDTCVQNFA
jgi:hypothetical protein